MTAEQRGFDKGDRVICRESGVIGKAIKFYYPIACKEQTMILCDDGRKYHAPSDTFVKVSELEEYITQADKERPQRLAMEAGISAGKLASQPFQIPHDYRNIKVAEGMTITIDLEESKKRLVESHYEKIRLNYGA